VRSATRIAARSSRRGPRMQGWLGEVGNPLGACAPDGLTWRATVHGGETPGECGKRASAASGGWDARTADERGIYSRISSSVL